MPIAPRGQAIRIRFVTFAWVGGVRIFLDDHRPYTCPPVRSRHGHKTTIDLKAITKVNRVETIHFVHPRELAAVVRLWRRADGMSITNLGRRLTPVLTFRHLAKTVRTRAWTHHSHLLLCGIPNAYLVLALVAGIKRCNVPGRVTKTTPITTMRSFIILLLIPFFLALATAKHVSNKLSAEGSYPRPLSVISLSG